MLHQINRFPEDEHRAHKVLSERPTIHPTSHIHQCQIGKFCSIASHVRINPGNHPMQRVTQHHMTYRRIEYGFADTAYR